MSEIYCLAPWNHLYKSANGYYGVCCRAERSFMVRDDHTGTYAATPEAAWNSQMLRSIRVAMLKNEPPTDICRNCLNNKVTAKTAASEHNRKAEPYIDQILAATLPNGYTTWMPKTLDIRTDICNFRCRTCYAPSSTAIQAEDHKAQRVSGKKITVNTVGPAYNSPTINSDLLSQVDSVYWAGGEPFASPTHWEVMQYLVDTGRASEVEVIYSTNLSFPGKTLDKAINTLKHFKHVFISASCDAAGLVAGYLRVGLDMEDYTKHFLAIQSLMDKKDIRGTICFDLTLTSIGLVALTNTIDYVIQLKAKRLTSRVVNIPDNHYLSLCALKPEVFHSKIAEARLALASSLDMPAGVRDSFRELLDYAETQYHPAVPDLTRLAQDAERKGNKGFYELVMYNAINEPSTEGK